MPGSKETSHDFSAFLNVIQERANALETPEFRIHYLQNLGGRVRSRIAI